MRNVPLDPKLLDRLEVFDELRATNEELLALYEDLVIAFAKSPRKRGIGAFKEKYRRRVLLLMRRGTMFPPSPSANY